MDEMRKNLLEESFDRIINVGFCIVPYEDLSDIIDINPVVFGTTKDEKIFSIEEVDALFKSQFEQMGNMKPELDRKRIATRISPDGNQGYIVEEITLTLSSPEETNTIFMRASCVMEYVENRWKLTHWHTSTPVDTENDHWHQEEWKREKEKLQKLVDQQTADLQGKNRELKIEAALERIRAQATAMKESSDLLDIVVTMRSEFVNLGHEAHYFWHMRWLPEHYKKAMTSGDGTRIGMVMTLPRHIHGDIEPVAEWEKSKEPTYVLAMDVDTAVDYVDKMISLGDFEQVDPQAPTLDDIRHIGGLTFIMARTTHGEIGYSLPGVVPDPPKDAVHTLVRFAGVFDLAYKRFEDLKAAERQHREAQIELALERVRARTMAMQSSDEFADVAAVLFDQVRTLGGNLWGTGFGLCEENADNDEFWFANENGVFPAVSIPNTEDPAHKQMYEGWKSNKEFLALEGSGEDLKNHYNYMMTLPEVRPFFQKILDEGLTFPEWQQWNAAYFSHGYLLIITLEPYSNQEILKRFARVFDQTYTRFLDLQKAEAQAREAQIEAALERVRSNAMAMQSSRDLNTLIGKVFTECTRLGIQLDRGIIMIYDPDIRDARWWFANPEVPDDPREFLVPYHNHAPYLALLEGWKNRVRKWTYILEGKEKEEWDAFIFSETELAMLPAEVKQIMMGFKKVHLNASFNSFGNLTLATLEPMTDSNFDILLRFARVFDLTYTRFNDLKQAEAQAREAQINLAVERVRARALAMFKSEEILEVVHKLKEEIMGLNIPNVAAATIHLKEPDGSCRVWDLTSLEIEDEDLHLPLDIRFRLDDTDPDFFMRRVWENDADYFVVVQEESDFKHTIQWLRDNHQLEQANETEEFFKTTQLKKVYHPTVPLKNGRMCIDLLDAPAPEIKSILKKMGGAFDLAYKRFEDLQQAEEQARKAEIEASLERVRAKAMAMHSSKDIESATAVVFNELTRLGIDMERCGIVLIDETPIFEIWSTLLSTKNREVVNVITGHIDSRMHPMAMHFHQDWQAKKDYSFYKLKGDEVREYYDKLEKQPDYQFPKIARYPDQQIAYNFFFNEGCIFVFTADELTGEERNIFERFAKVFEQTYTRFLDIQKAEAQAREAEIEASLERVRAKAMAMHSSKDIESATAVVFNELSRLGIDMDRCGIILMNETPIVEVWSTPLSQDSKEVVNVITGYLDFGMHPMLQQVYQDWREKKNSTIYKLVGDEVKKYYAKLEKQPEYKFPKVASYPDQQIINTFYFKEGGIFAYTQDDLSAEAKDIIQKFSNVFAQTYTRFLDIQKAEEQARKAEIEASLERVRAKAMAMHSSKDIKSATAVVFNELSRLGINMERCGISLMNETPIGEIWSTPLSKDNKEVVDIITGHLDFGIHPILQKSYQDWRGKKDFSAYKLVGDEVKNYYAKLEKQPEYKFPKVASYPDQQILNTFYFKDGGIFAFTVDELSEEAKDIIQKFTKVFSQTYTRFLDIQKAEAQAHEAKIETALEKVRSRTMGMQSSDELPKVANLLFLEVQELGIPAWSCGYCILLEDRRSSTCIMSSEGTLQKPFLLPHSGEASFNEWDLFVQGEETFFTQELGGKALESHYNFMKSLPQLGPIFKEIEEAGLSLPTYQINHLCKFAHGFLLFITYEKVPDAHDIFKRFTRVFEQTYTRFLDLKKAEAQALEATKQASLDRVRGEIASMRSAKDLELITPLVWNELNTLGIPFIRCGVFIVHEEEKEVEVYLSKPDGTSLAVMHLPFGSSDLANQTVDAWKQSSVYTQHWTREEFLDWGRSMVEQGQVQDLKTYRGAESPPESLNLHFIPFKQGMLYVGSTNPLNNEEINLAASLAEAFAIAYARYEDFVKLEKAKEGIENALADLKATQSQLVQQEKLASLGQLTAGIAHEIKNPLNFVNNFSELSVELIEEAREEVRRVTEDRGPGRGKEYSPLKKGDKGGCTSPDQSTDADSNIDPALILSILDDIEANLRKIHEHGSRADGIVKSMLQHSRGGDGKMEPTDLNSLVKEYVNLAFHGMRAGKEPINVDIDLQLDESVGDVPLVAEDFSRVILNLCNNGFDAMREKLLVVSGQSSVVYQPKLTVRTKSDGKNLTLEIEDNGPGISEEIKDKIMQPFFTTKKGTAGTGLGLSITNDIIKAHGGILEVKTGAEGSTFSIHVQL